VDVFILKDGVYKTVQRRIAEQARYQDVLLLCNN